jgi:hypothetical protein
MESLKDYFIISKVVLNIELYVSLTNLTICNFSNFISIFKIKEFKNNKIFAIINKNKAQMNEEYEKVKDRLQTFVTRRKFDSARQQLLTSFESLFKLFIELEKYWNLFRSDDYKVII